MSQEVAEKKQSFEHELDLAEHLKALPEKSVDEAAEQRAEAPVINAAEAAKDVAKASAETDSQSVLEGLNAAENEPATMSRTAINHELKSISKRRELKQLQRTETLPQRSFSRVIHQPVIRGVSEAAGKTVSRPSGLLGGGLVAFLGSGSYFVLAKYVGFTYNYTVSLALFVGGFVFGLALELFVHLATASRRQVD